MTDASCFLCGAATPTGDMCDPCWDNFLYREDVEAERGDHPYGDDRDGYEYPEFDG
jgi:hypothetical protein